MVILGFEHERAGKLNLDQIVEDIAVTAGPADLSRRNA